jgi:carbon-monoxide dehydrogenase small subunit
VSEQGSSHYIETVVNKTSYRRVVRSRQLLVHFLRDELGLTGTHIGCDTGNCGACTIIYDGRLVKSCMLLAPQADGVEIETVEGLAAEGSLNALQRSFHEHHALQCGYCTPGMLMSATYLLRRNPSPSEAEIRRGIRGNVCRCTGYVNIVRAIASAASAASAGSGGPPEGVAVAGERAKESAR